MCLEARQECPRPEAVAEQTQDFLPLGVVLFLADRPGAECFSGKVAPHQEVDIFCWYLGKLELEKGLFGFEIADLQHAGYFSGQPFPLLRDGKFFCGKREILRALEIVEVRQPVKGSLLGFGDDGKVLVEGAHGR